MDEFICPRCRTTKFQNPSLKMLVNVCGHGLCESCVDLLFLKGSGTCPKCHISLRRNNFRIQLFEDSNIEKEVDIRKRILKDYNKKQEDFVALSEYNDYLEQVESIIFNLCNDIDVEETKTHIEQYKRDNKEQIQRNRIRVARENNELDEIIKMEQRQSQKRQLDIQCESKEIKIRKIRTNEALIDHLMYSTDNANNVMDTLAVVKGQNLMDIEPDDIIPSKLNQFSTGIQFGRKPSNHILPLTEGSPTYSYHRYIVTIQGPKLPIETKILSSVYTKHIRSISNSERAGGFQALVACQRALCDAMAGLYFNFCNIN